MTCAPFCPEPCSPACAVRSVAERYEGDDDEAERLTEAALRRLEWRKRHGGKECASCHEAKPVSEFGQDSRERDGLHRICRSCRNAGPLLK